MTLSLGIDIGTSGVRTAVLDGDGTLISMARAAHLPQDGAAIDAEKWWHAVEACLHTQIDTLTGLGRDPQDISGIAVDGTSGTMVLTDTALRPVSPALMYNSKGFAAEAKAIAASPAPEQHIAQGSNSALARAMSLLSAATGTPMHLMHQADFIAARLTGVGGQSDDNNALKTGYDPELGAWPDWIDQVFPAHLLPSVHPVGTPLHHVAPDIARRFGLSRDAYVHAGTTDSTAAFLAAAPLRAGVAVTSIGSTLAVKAVSPSRLDLPEQGLYSHKVGPFWLAGGASNTGGAVLAHHFSVDQIIALSPAIDPATDSGLDYYPLLSPGERFPVNDPTLPPRLDPRPDDDAAFLKGLFEGIARIEAACYRLIDATGGMFPDQIHTAGGAAQNDTLTQIRGRYLGTQPAPALHTEAAIGAARLCQMGG